MNRAMRMMYAPRSCSVRSAQSSRRCHFSVRSSRFTVRSPTKWPIPNEMLSPMTAPAAPATTTRGKYMSPDAERLPPMTTSVSLGTTGKNASITAIAKITR
jgi:hypothetical protein